MARDPYRIARQEHLGDTLDELQRRGRLRWWWDYDVSRSRAMFNIEMPGRPWVALGTRAAEKIVQAECDALGMRWRPVPPPGGEAQRAMTITWIEEGNAS